MEAYRSALEEGAGSSGGGGGRWVGGRGVAVIHSVAGGTGAGLGSRIVEELRNEDPKGWLMNCAVMPFSSGETTLQHYNSLFTLAWMQKHSDLLLLFSNDTLLHTATRQLNLHTTKSTTASSKKVTLDNLNTLIARSLANLLLPTTPVDPPPPSEHFLGLKGGRERTVDWIPTVKPSRGFDGWDVLKTVAPFPGMKLCNLSSTWGLEENPKGFGSTWEDTTSTLTRSLPLAPAFTVGAYLQSRSALEPTYHRSHHAFVSKIQSKMGRILFPTDTFATRISCTPSGFPHVGSTDPRKSWTLLSNTSNSIPILDDLLEKAGKVWDARAYVHWLERYTPGGKRGVEELMGEGVEVLKGAKGWYEDCGGLV
ncbi:hypothetical protein HDV05_004251 [Chytridiales sp. JEL 0842]|nr:hypothetical protein HDV05_004251 [Chytridiales sp. JEL 0842]